MTRSESHYGQLAHGCLLTQVFFDRNVPYNALLDQGYRSVGDWHSTAAPTEGDKSDGNERGNRWQGRNKSECGLHKDYFEMKKAFEEKHKAVEEVAIQKEGAAGV